MILSMLMACASRVQPVVRDEGPRPAPLVGDFDGDGRGDRARLSREDGRIGLTIRFGSGEIETLGPGTWERVDDDGTIVPEALPEELSFVVGWATLRRAGGETVDPAGHLLPDVLPLPDLQGDALWVASLDAAIVVYRASSGWRFVELGY